MQTIQLIQFNSYQQTTYLFLSKHILQHQLVLPCSTLSPAQLVHARVTKSEGGNASFFFLLAFLRDIQQCSASEKYHLLLTYPETFKAAKTCQLQDDCKRVRKQQCMTARTMTSKLTQ